MLLPNETYALWEKVFLKWENGNILDGTRKLPIGKVTPIGKLAFNCLVGLREFQMATLAQGLLNYKYMLRERSTKLKVENNLKTMLE